MKSVVDGATRKSKFRHPSHHGFVIPSIEIDYLSFCQDIMRNEFSSGGRTDARRERNRRQRTVEFSDGMGRDHESNFARVHQFEPRGGAVMTRVLCHQRRNQDGGVEKYTQAALPVDWRLRTMGWPCRRAQGHELARTLVPDLFDGFRSIVGQFASMNRWMAAPLKYGLFADGLQREALLVVV